MPWGVRGIGPLYVLEDGLRLSGVDGRDLGADEDALVLELRIREQRLRGSGGEAGDHQQREVVVQAPGGILVHCFCLWFYLSLCLRGAPGRATDHGRGRRGGGGRGCGRGCGRGRATSAGASIQCEPNVNVCFLRILEGLLTVTAPRAKHDLNSLDRAHASCYSMPLRGLPGAAFVGWSPSKLALYPVGKVRWYVVGVASARTVRPVGLV